MEKLLYGSLSPLLRLLTFFWHTAVFFFSVFTASPTFPAIHGRKSSSMRNSHSLLFDYDNQLFLSNQSAKKLFPFIADRNGSLDIHDFISSLGLKEQVPDLKQDIQFYWTSQDSGHTSYICSLTALKYKPGKPVAWMFLFTSNLMESDPLTDFQSQQYFEQHRAEDLLRPSRAHGHRRM